VQTPQYAIDSIDALACHAALARRLQRQDPDGRQPHPDPAVTGPVNITHFNVARTFDVPATSTAPTWARSADAIENIVAAARAKAPTGTRITIKGQVESMNSSFGRAELGLLFAILLVYLLMW